jgi:hypothetical protein
MGDLTVSSITAIIQTCTNFGFLGAVFWLFVLGKLHSDREMERSEEDLRAERAAHELTRQALALANERANSSLISSQIIARALSPGGGDIGEGVKV